MNIDSLEQLLIDQLRELLKTEAHQIEALPEIIELASNEELKMAIEFHLMETESQVSRLEMMLAELEVSPECDSCDAISQIMDETVHSIAAKITPAVRDVALGLALQKMEHYEIAAYGAAREYARLLGWTRVQDLLQRSLDEEYAAEAELSVLGLRKLNAKALV